ncbi:MAG: DNA repair protein RecN [Bacillota bacterium]|jgi:DNA repair protein RecN (Recombination protein N)
MLRELYVENFGLIEKSNINFSPGLNVLTGETGAGKSLIIDAVGLLIGGRGSQDFIRTGAEKLVLQGTFEGNFSPDLKDILFEAGFTWENDALILSREISRTGKNTCRVNFRIVPLSMLKEIGRRLINIHGQHEHVNLLEEETQLLLLDSFGGSELHNLREKVREAFQEIKKIKNKTEELKLRTENVAKKEDYLKFQIREIEEANLETGEDLLLEKERKVLQNAEKLASSSKLAYEKLYGGRGAGAWDMVGETAEMLKEISLLDEKAEEIFQKVNEIYFLLEDVVRELGDYGANILNDPYRLDEIEQRINLINNLKRKYGGSIEEIKHSLKLAQEELKDLENQEANFKELASLLEKAEDNYQALSFRLTDLRKKAAEKLSLAVTEELHELHMSSAEFQVSVTPSSMSLNGVDQVDFLVKPNFGEEIKPVVKIASGGELSRIMLGMKVILSQLDQIPTLIFDEIDSGLGGKAIYDVGKKLKTIALSCQVICVTHSPVIASFADHHLKILKERKEERTVTIIETLPEDKVILELGRMLAGDNISEITLSQARELLRIGNKNFLKKKI